MKFLKKLMDYHLVNLPFMFLNIGCLFLFIPSFFPEIKLLYILGVWIWPFCYLFYGRFSKRRFNQSILFIYLALGLNIRFFGVLGEGLEFENALLMLFVSCAFWVPFAWDARYYRFGSNFVYTLVFPVVYGTLNLILSACNVIPICNLAYAQYDNKSLLQVVSLIGEYGLTFLITWVASIGVYVCENRHKKSGKIAAASTVCVLVSMHIWGAVRIMNAEECTQTVRIAQAIGPKLRQIKGEWEILSFERNFDSFNNIVEDAVSKGAEMLVLSEEAFTIYDVKESLFVANAVEKAKQYHMPILLPLEVDDSDDDQNGRLFNKVILIDGDGVVRSEYLKHNAVPVVETSELVVGEGKIPTDSITIGGKKYVLSYVICYDGNFTDYIRRMDPSTQLYFNPSWDWESINDFHYRSIGIRSVENGVNLVMTTYDGWSVVSDPYGNEIARTYIEDHGYEKVFMTDVPTLSLSTLYMKIGGTLNLVYPVFSLFFIAFGHRKKRNEDDEDEDEE